ncbi:D11 protein [Vibrio phage Javier]|uniref:D11 protein n=2 Tax=Thalassavirus TaxID=2948922 RepID=A0A6M9Z3E0_9CAUD|nr:single strand DNA binding protein [Vibrio phage Achelous]YP_010108476.1 single strand DNA binding protein [Vibrio phage Quinn]QIG66358.1 D11 protein [Vibrio phage Chazly21]QQO89683.1 D11 protein [Vibrio phage GRLPWR]WBF69415.1 D11 protein [Vibrio phage IW18]WBU76474.1 D11 protein [Vibrio phage Chloris]WBU76661.1 D11 protein [Vibrio phage Javier]
MTMTTTASNWGTVTAGDNGGEKKYTKYKAGANKFRIVGDILPRFVYWLSTVKTDDEGKPRKLSAPFDCLSFDATPGVEKFINGAPDPIKELGIQNTDWQGNPEFDKKGQPVPLKSQRQYLFPIMNRDSGEYEYATLKGDTLAGVGELMAKLSDPKQRRRFADPDYAVNSPSDIDIVLVKSGAGLGTKYKVDIVETMENVLDEDSFKAMMERFEADAEILKDKKAIQEVFPRPTYAEQKEEVHKFLHGDEDEAGESAPSDAAQEAMDELD